MPSGEVCCLEVVPGQVEATLLMSGRDAFFIDPASAPFAIFSVMGTKTDNKSCFETKLLKTRKEKTSECE